MRDRIIKESGSKDNLIVMTFNMKLLNCRNLSEGLNLITFLAFLQIVKLLYSKVGISFIDNKVINVLHVD